jgi:hypothetical protein
MNSSTAVNYNQEDYVELIVNLKLKKNIAEALRILSICYSKYPTLQDELLSKFLEREITKIVHVLSEAPPGSQEWPLNFKAYLKSLVSKEDLEDI